MNAPDIDLERFRRAQRQDVAGQADAVAEIRSGGKRTHWIWYILPQYRGLGFSIMSECYAITSLDEAIAYLGDEELAGNLYEMCDVILASETDDPVTVMGGYIDAQKLRSSVTLFEQASEGGDDTPFAKVLDRFYGGERDEMTLKLLGLALEKNEEQ